jgi:mannitol/fructose-specific phosphotransferase system IIA component (Ntr-type)
MGDLMKILDYLDEGKVVMGIKESGKKELIEKLVSVLLEGDVDGDKKKIENALLDREKTGSTGIGNEVAIPHAKTDDVSSVGLVYAYSFSGVEYDSVDGKPAKYFFLVVSPFSQASIQLMLLARISRLMGNRIMRNELSSARTAKETLEVIRKYEE